MIMAPNKYLRRMDERRESLTGISRTWADFNMTLEILDVRPTPEVAEMAAEDCKKIIADLESRPQTQDVADALEIKKNQLKGLENRSVSGKNLADTR